MKKQARIAVIRKPFSGAESQPQSSIGGRKITVIVVDDDYSVCRALRTQLEILGFNVVLFQSAKGLLASKIPSRDACLLADVYMPRMSGVELCQQLRAKGVSLPTVLMSGRDDDGTKRAMRDARPITTLFKPFSQTTLLRAIEKATRRRARRSEAD